MALEAGLGVEGLGVGGMEVKVQAVETHNLAHHNSWQFPSERGNRICLLCLCAQCQHVVWLVEGTRIFGD